MKTAREMYQYCLNNKYGSGMNKTWGIKHFTLIEKALKSDEEAIMCFIGLHNYISATKHDNNFAYAITSKRIIMAQQKIIGQIVQTVAIEHLNDITLNLGIVFGIITVDTIKEKFNVAVDRQAAKNINNRIDEALLSVRQQQKPPIAQTSMSAADEILKYKNLLDMGVITQSEFDEKKKQLLKI